MSSEDHGTARALGAARAALGRGDEPAVAAALERGALDLAAALRLDDAPADEDRDAFLRRADGHLCPLLGTAAGVVEHGSDRLLAQLGAALRHVARTSSLGDAWGAHPASTVVVARVTWATVAVAVALDRPAVLPALVADAPAPGSGRPAPLLARADLRAPQALGGLVPAAYADLGAWLAAHALCVALPLLPSVLEEALADADVLLAAVTAAHVPHGAASAALDAGAASRLAGRAGRRGWRGALADVLGGEEPWLGERVAEVYGRLVATGGHDDAAPASLPLRLRA